MHSSALLLPPFQEGRVVVELGEVASATRFNLFGPALYSLDAQDSFGDDVKVRWLFTSWPLSLCRWCVDE